MRIALRYTIAVTCVLVLALSSLWLIASKQNAEEQHLIAELKNTLSSLELNNVKYFGRGEDCQFIVYRDRRVSSKPNIDCGPSQTKLDAFHRFEQSDTEVFDPLSSELPSKVEFVGVQYYSSEKILEVEFRLTAMHRTYGYVYHPAYGGLPQNDADNRYE